MVQAPLFSVPNLTSPIIWSHIDYTKKEKRRCYGCYKKDEEEMAGTNYYYYL